MSGRYVGKYFNLPQSLCLKIPFKRTLFFPQTPKKTNVYVDLSIRNNNITDFLFSYRWVMVDIGGLWWQDGRI